MAKNRMGCLMILLFFCLLQNSQQEKSLQNPKSDSTTTSAEEFVWSEVEKHGIGKMNSAAHSGVFNQYYNSLDRKQNYIVANWMSKLQDILEHLVSSKIVIIPSQEFLKGNPEREGFFNVYLTPEKKVAKELWINSTAVHNYKNTSNRGGSPFGMICALPGIEPKIVKYLLDSGIDVNVKSGVGNATALLAAADTGNLPLVKFLVENGADIDAAIEVPMGPKDGRFIDNYITIFSKKKYTLPKNSKVIITPLSAAVSELNIEVIKYLLVKGADVNVRNTTWTMFFPPVITDFQELLTLLLQHGLNVNGTDTVGQTMLHKTAAKGNLPMSKLLLKYNADVTATDHFGWTPLHFAALYARNDSKQLIKQLLDQGSDINAKTDGGFSPLNLLEAGSDFTFLNYLLVHLPLNSTSERKSVRLSEKGSRIDIVRLFLERGADPNHQDDILGWSTLHWAAAVGDSLVWKLLVEEYGASSAAKSKQGWTPADTAKYFNL